MGGRMRRLVLMRHAKAERGGPGVEDFDRALTERGVTDAALVGAALARSGITPDLTLASAAARTRQTWAAICGLFPKARAELRRNLYHAEANTLLRAIE